MFEPPDIEIPQVNAAQRSVQRIAAVPLVSRLCSKILPPIDHWLLRTSKGSLNLTTALAGLPIVQLITTGSRSGRTRVSTLVAIPQQQSLILIASNFGSSRHPAWYHNLVANPQTQVQWQDSLASYHAHETRGAQRDLCWQLAVQLYPGYQAYALRAAPRVIPVIWLSPDDS